MVLYILAIFLHSMQQKWDQGTLGTQRLTLIGPRTRLGPSMDPAMALQYTQHISDTLMAKKFVDQLNV